MYNLSQKLINWYSHPHGGPDPFRQRHQVGPEAAKKQAPGAGFGRASAALCVGRGYTGHLARCGRPELDEQFRHLLGYLLPLAGLVGRCRGAADVRSRTKSLREERRHGGILVRLRESSRRSDILNLETLHGTV